MSLTYKERQKVMTEFRENPFQDVVSIIRPNGVITISRSNQIAFRISK